MEGVVNYKLNQIVVAAPRCGTNFLTNVSIQLPDWLKNFTIEEIPLTEHMQLVKVVRDPIDRWISWFNCFILNDQLVMDIELPFNTTSIKKIDQWCEDFKKVYYLDEHVMFQVELYNHPLLSHPNTRYLDIRNLTNFFQIKEPHQKSYRDLFNLLPKLVKNKILANMRDHYREDSLWVNKVKSARFLS